MYLLYAYIASLIVGGILLAASLALGHDHDADLDADFDADFDADLDADADGHSDLSVGDVWLPFLSLRFWVFFLAFFGATGTALTLLALASRWATLAASLATGAVIGLSAAVVIHRLKKQVVGEVAGAKHFKGKDGAVLLPIAVGERGKVRMTVKGQTVDMAARSDVAIPIGAKVLVIDVERDELVVVPMDEVSN